jgi:hypothetical protein
MFAAVSTTASSRKTRPDEQEVTFPAGASYQSGSESLKLDAEVGESEGGLLYVSTT